MPDDKWQTYLFDEFKYLRKKSEERAIDAAGVKQKLVEVEARCESIESNLAKMTQILWLCVIAGAGSGPLVSFLTK